MFSEFAIKSVLMHCSVIVICGIFTLKSTGERSQIKIDHKHVKDVEIVDESPVAAAMSEDDLQAALSEIDQRENKRAAEAKRLAMEAESRLRDLNRKIANEKSKAEKLRREQDELERENSKLKSQAEKIENDKKSLENKVEELKKKSKERELEKRKAKEEALKAEEAKKKRQEEERKRLKAEAEAARIERERRLTEKRIAHEKAEAARQAQLKAEDAELQRYKKEIHEIVIRNWIKPSFSKRGWGCSVRVTVDRQGRVKSVSINYCHKNKLFEKSVLEAVERSSPFPLPKMDSVYQSEINFDFEVK